MGQLAQETEIVFSLRLCDKLLLCETAKLILMDTKPNTPKHTHTHIHQHTGIYKGIYGDGQTNAELSTNA